MISISTRYKAVYAILYNYEHLSSHPVLCGVRVDRSLVFSVVFLKIIVCPFVLFHLTIVLSVLRFKDYDCPFGIFKLS